VNASATGSYDRTRLMSRAAAASKKGRRRKAIALYRRVLAIEPNNVELHQKLAPLLAEAGRAEEAVASYLEIARADREGGRVRQALETLRGAVAFFPAEVGLWEAMAELHLHRERPAEAVAVLREGLGHLRRRRHRGRAVRLQRRLYELTPRDTALALSLAAGLRRIGLREPAASLLRRLEDRARPAERKAIRAQQLRLRPTPANLWRWLRA